LGASVHILSGPPGPDLTRRLLAEYVPRTRDVGSALWLAPTERAARDTLRRIADGGRSVLLPNVFTVSDFAQAVLARAIPAWSPPSPSERRLLLDEVIADLVRKRGIDYFRRVADTRGFLDGADGFLDELDELGVSAAEFSGAISGARASKLAACAEIVTALAQRDIAESPVRRAADVIRTRLPGPFDRIRSVFVDGCVALSHGEWGIVEALAQRAEIWLALPANNARCEEAFAASRQVRERFSWGVVDSSSDATQDRPAALAHLDRQLFSSPVEPATDATGLHLIEAPGPVGEARLVARRIRTLLAAGVCPDDVVVTARTLTYTADLIEEVFSEYGLPVETECAKPLSSSPAVAALLRAIRLPEEGWPFAGVAALLRSTYFRPNWPEGDAETARRAEGLLRLLGEPRDRDAYLRAVRLWAETPPEGLEDEVPEASRRRRKVRLAAESRPFLERFFARWDDLTADGSSLDFAKWLRRFATDIGIEAASDEGDTAALASLWRALQKWNRPSVSRAAFLRGLATLCATETLDPGVASTGCVLVVAAEEARHLDCEYLFVMGLGEKSFPRLAPPASLIDDGDRVQLRKAGLPIPDPGDRLGTEQLLFLDLIARPRRELILSYSAIDEKGQSLLPGTFLRAVQECFAADVLRPERQRMLIEGYTSREPLSLAETRVQFAANSRGRTEAGAWRHPGLPNDLGEHLRWAEEVAAARFRSRDYNRYDGWLDSSAAQAEVRDRLGPDHVFSPTALETYVACPFKFLLGHVLSLEELDEPGEEVEQTRRGAAYHRALARLHRKLREADPEMTRERLPDRIGPELLAEIDVAIQEYAARAPSAASKKLWELEGKRLHRSAAHYRDHWDKYVDPWRNAKAPPAPHLLEADFGVTGAPAAPLVISVGGVEVQIGGRIDRVDVAELDGELGFWVIDYKTGRAQNYTSTSLSNLEKMQLTLYALAVERVFYPGRKARPLGLAYWMVTDTGPKGVLPRQAMGWQSDPDAWAKFRGQLEAWVAKLVSQLRAGRFPLAPRSENCTETCSFGQVCRISQSRNTGKTWELSPG